MMYTFLTAALLFLGAAIWARIQLRFFVDDQEDRMIWNAVLWLSLTGALLILGWCAAEVIELQYQTNIEFRKFVHFFWVPE